MLVLSRQVDETVMIGESISVTVVSITSDSATLFVRYEDETQRVKQKLALEVDDRLEITSDVHVHIVDIRDDKVRLGIVAPKVLAVHRKEVFEAIKRENRAYAIASLKPVSLCNGQHLLIGENLMLILAPTTSGDRELRSRGQLVGGARDGEAFERSDPISVGSMLEFGSLVRVSVSDLSAESVGLKIDHPVHMICRVKK